MSSYTLSSNEEPTNVLSIGSELIILYKHQILIFEISKDKIFQKKIVNINKALLGCITKSISFDKFIFLCFERGFALYDLTAYKFQWFEHLESILDAVYLYKQVVAISLTTEKNNGVVLVFDLQAKKIKSALKTPEPQTSLFFNKEIKW